MSELSEEEIIKILANIVEDEQKFYNTDVVIQREAIQGLLDLYKKEKLNSFNLIEQLNKEKEKNKKLEIYENVINNREYTWKQKYEETFDYVKDEFVSKDKIREKIAYYELVQAQEDDKETIEHIIYALNELLEE